jgi:RimJ/RimL family protein N-acetyltransferase
MAPPGLPLGELDGFWATLLDCPADELRTGKVVLHPGPWERAQIFLTSDGGIVIGPPHILELAATLSLDRLLDAEMWAARLEVLPTRLTSFATSLFYTTSPLFRRPAPHPFVRQLKRRDAEALARFNRILDAAEPGRPRYWSIGGRMLGTPQTRLWGAYFEARLVSVAGLRTIGEAITEIGVETLPKARNQGYGVGVAGAATAGALKLGSLVQWSTQADNVASTRLAVRLGFRAYAHQLWLGPSLPPGQLRSG